MRSSRFLVSTVTVLLIGALCSVPSGEARQKQYNEVVELMSEMGRTFCLNLGKVIKQGTHGKRFNVARRCDLFMECLEDLGGMTDAMTKELDMTHQDMVNNALMFPHYATLQMHVKNAAKMALAKRAPSEKELNDELHRMMSQWILNVAVSTPDHVSGSGIENLPREQQRNFRGMGMRLPQQGILDDDDLEEQQYMLNTDDENWAKMRGHEVVDEEEEADF